MGIKRRIVLLPASELKVDEKYQRVLRDGWVRELARNWDDAGSGVLIVSQRNGTYYVLDGQHRVAATALAGDPDKRLRCEVYTGLSLQDEANLFKILNTQKALSALDRFHARVAANDPVALGIRRTVQGLGLRVSRSTAGTMASRTVNCIAALEKVYEADGNGELLRRVLQTLMRAWGEDYSVVHQQLVVGVARVWSEHPDWDGNRFTDRLAAVPGGASGFRGKALNLHETTGRPVSECMQIVAETVYRGRRRMRLAGKEAESA